MTNRASHSPDWTIQRQDISSWVDLLPNWLPYLLVWVLAAVGTSRHFAAMQNLVAVEGIADIERTNQARLMKT